jgi:hypothetical protein
MQLGEFGFEWSQSMQDRTGSDAWAEQADSDGPAERIKWGFGVGKTGHSGERAAWGLYTRREISKARAVAAKKKGDGEKTPA